ncbi:putative membrane protein [Streptomyces calvus]|uniref:SHOCT domain-containing protein n=1 Tax=Streptomyces calvus TaxID=67282 RepID=UPI00351738E2
MLYWNAHGMSGWGWFAMSLSTVVFWALLIGLGVLIFRNANRGPVDIGGQAGGATAERLLAERFASGEIDENEYRRRLAVLRAPTSGGSRASP